MWVYWDDGVVLLEFLYCVSVDCVAYETEAEINFEVSVKKDE